MAMTEHAPQITHLEEELRELRSILGVAQAVVSSLELDEVLENILFSAMAIMEMPAGAVVLYDEKRAEMVLHAHAGLGAELAATARWEVRPASLTERILAEGEPFVVEDTRRSDFVINPRIMTEGVCAVIAVPLKIQNKIVGVLYLDDFVPRCFPELRLRLLGILASFAAMSIDNARLHETTRQLARTDGLTGLYNYREFQQVFQEELARAGRYRNPLSLIMFDIDDFKQFNDTFGHPSGDKVLIDVARILQDSLRECDVVFRYGGEEFIAILPETGIDAALAAAERARLAVEEYTPDTLGPIAGQGVTVSAGVASYPRDGHGLDTLLQATDDLLYLAKKHGKNKVYQHPDPR